MNINVVQHDSEMIEFAYACGDISHDEHARLINDLAPELNSDLYVRADTKGQAEWWGSFG